MREGEFFHLSQIQRQFCVICNISYFPLCFPLLYGLACLGDSGKIIKLISLVFAVFLHVCWYASLSSFRSKPHGTGTCNCWWKIQTIWKVYPLKSYTNSLDLLFTFSNFAERPSMYNHIQRVRDSMCLTWLWLKSLYILN